MSSTSSPAPPVFSYAQAARGLPSGAASSQKSTDISAASSEKGTGGRKPSSTDGEKLEIRSKSSEANADATSPAGSKPHDAPHTSPIASKDVVESESTKLSRRSESAEESKVTTSPTIISLSESEPFGNSKDEDVSLGPNGASDTWERHSEASTSVDRGNAPNDKDKSQAGDDDWEKVSVPSTSQERELKAAPPPAVNIWQQRKEAQEAKQREQGSQRPASSGSKSTTTPGPAADLTKAKNSERNAGTQERDMTSKRKPAEAAKTTGDKTSHAQSIQGRPSSRGQPSGLTLPLPPPVGDAIAWPTPETAIEAEDRRKSSLDTNEKPEGKPTGTKQPKKWTQVPFVPTAVFNTPLPPAATKRGGRANARGGREGTGRGGHMTQSSISGEKSEVAGSMGPPPLPRQADQDRGRRPDPTRGGRATSVPTQGRRATSSAGTQTESRKVSGTGNPSAGLVAGEEPASTKAQESRSSSRPTDVSSKEVLNSNVEATETSLASENDHAHPTIDPGARAIIPTEWYNKPGGVSARLVGEQSTKDRNQPRTRTVAQESREKVQSWRDHESQADTGTRRDSRPERGGRGSYRTRGNGYVPAGTHAYTAPLPQQPFAPHKSQPYNDPRQRQPSQPYGMQITPGGSRVNNRSHSIPMQQPMPNGMPLLSPITTDIGQFGYNPPPMHPYYAGVVPHHPGLDMFGLVSLVTAQLDYYFSIDNLCRDMYLRGHMDSQGFVSLRVIHGFKRMASMAANVEMLCLAAGQSKVIEIRQGDDGEDRVRRREGWEQWVLAMEERNPAARNAGPSAQSNQPRRPNYGPLTNFAESPYTMGSPMRSPSWGVPGYSDMSGLVSPVLPQQSMANDHGMMEQTTQFHSSGSVANGECSTAAHAAAPQGHSRSSSFVPAINGTESNPTTNGHGEMSQGPELPSTDQENVFPNEKLSSVWVYARKGDDDTPPFVSNATRTFSQGSRSGMDASVNGVTSPTFVSGLRGGAASPEQIQRLHSQDQLPFADGSRQNGTFFLKDGVSQSDFDREGSDPWPYQILHAKALEQRDQGLHGADNHEMEILYQFWPTFLFQNFNAGMYNDFYRFALEDLNHGSKNGSTHLAKYYGYKLAADKPLSDRAAHDIVAAIGQENGDSRPIFQKVRAFWRDGAFNFKSRKRINDLLDASLREELAK